MLKRIKGRTLTLTQSFTKKKYDLQKRIFLLKRFYKFGSIVRVQREYCANFNEKIAPNHSTIRKIVSVFEKTGSVSSTPPQNTKVPARSEKTPKMSLKPW